MKFKKSLTTLLVVAVAMLFLVGCAEDESPVAPSNPLEIVILAGPSGDVPFNAYVTFKWQAKGGSGNYTQYSYQLSGVDASAQNTVETTKTYQDLSGVGDHTFTVTVTDSKGATAQASRSFKVIQDAAAPTVSIEMGPAEGSKVAENTSVTFTWSGDDPGSFFGLIDGYEFSLTSDGGYSNTSGGMVDATSASFDSLPSGNFTFKVKAIDNAGLSSMDSVKFVVQKANIMLIDDFDFGGKNEEFLERNEWATALNGFAWEELDMSETYTVSSATADVLEEKVNGAGSTTETIIWNENGSDDNFMMWWSTNGVGSRTPWLFNFLDRGGNLVLIGSNIMDQIWNSVPPAAGDFEDVYQGLIPDSEFVQIDTTITTTTRYDSALGGWVTVVDTSYDTTTFDVWMNDDYITLTGANGYTNISIDVGKDPNTHQDGYVFTLLKPSAKPIMIDDDTGFVTGFVYENAFGGKVVTLGMNLYYSPTQEIRDVVQKILSEEFGH